MYEVVLQSLTTIVTVCYSSSSINLVVIVVVMLLVIRQYAACASTSIIHKRFQKVEETLTEACHGKGSTLSAKRFGHADPLKCENIGLHGQFDENVGFNIIYNR